MSNSAPELIFQQYGGSESSGFFSIDSPAQQTPGGVLYLSQPGVSVISRPQVHPEALKGFLEGFDSSLQFPAYLDDPTELPDGAQLCKIAGQTCYLSFSPKRTFNDQAKKYFDNLKSSQHGSVFEHANFSLLFYGISRSVTHELIRHRAGFGFSQVSQRYVSGRVLRFVERPEYRDDEQLHTFFIQRIERAAEEYATLTNKLLEQQKSGNVMFTSEVRTDLRKKVQQCARSVLPNETEAPIVTTGNARAWRHFIEMRADPHAEIEIRELAVRVFLCLRMMDPVLFGDYTLQQLPDGTYFVETEFRKI